MVWRNAEHYRDPTAGAAFRRIARKEETKTMMEGKRFERDFKASVPPDGHTVHDYDERFRLEDDGLIPGNQPFRWSVLDETQLTADWYITHGGDHHDQR